MARTTKCPSCDGTGGIRSRMSIESTTYAFTCPHCVEGRIKASYLRKMRLQGASWAGVVRTKKAATGS